MKAKFKHHKFQVIVDITIAKYEEDDPPTKEEIEIGILRQLPGYDNVIRGLIEVDRVAIKD